MAAERRRGERATAMVLAPAMALVVILLGGVAVDLSNLHLAQRSAQRVAAAAADDAAGLIDTRRVQADGRVVIDPVRARTLAEWRVRSAGLRGRTEDLAIASDADTVTVSFVLAVPSPLLGSFPGSADERRAPVSATARLYP